MRAVTSSFCRHQWYSDAVPLRLFRSAGWRYARCAKICDARRGTDGRDGEVRRRTRRKIVMLSCFSWPPRTEDNSLEPAASAHISFDERNSSAVALCECCVGGSLGRRLRRSVDDGSSFLGLFFVSVLGSSAADAADHHRGAESNASSCGAN